MVGPCPCRGLELWLLFLFPSWELTGTRWCMKHIEHPFDHIDPDLQQEEPERPLCRGCQAVMQPHVGSSPGCGIPIPFPEAMERAGSPAASVREEGVISLEGVGQQPGQCGGVQHLSGEGLAAEEQKQEFPSWLPAPDPGSHHGSSRGAGARWEAWGVWANKNRGFCWCTGHSENSGFHRHPLFNPRGGTGSHTSSERFSYFPKCDAAFGGRWSWGCG